MGNLGPGIPSSSQKEPANADSKNHPTVLITPVHSWRDRLEQVVAINRTTGRNQSEQLVRDHPVRAHHTTLPYSPYQKRQAGGLLGRSRAG